MKIFEKSTFLGVRDAFESIGAIGEAPFQAVQPARRLQPLNTRCAGTGFCCLRRAGLRRAEVHADADLRSAQVRDPAGGTRAAALRATVKVPSP